MVSRPQYDPPKSILKRAAVSNQNAKVPDQKEDENAAEEMPKGDGTEGLAKMRPIHGGELFAEDVDSQMAYLPEVTTTTEDVKLVDIRIVNGDENTPEEVDRLRQIF
ncbi:hypothetical protein L914_01160 [Phytophthora nicotianae]|uniref:Uncharacterized protein n=1 Tax=Phytophthora nicotianae TaxID=4792 RepID=W2P6R9_PHYNI|nr:hypothetical protein L914_01160 [Phytophthora nicotianae]